MDTTAAARQKQPARVRTRDPHRRETILRAAARLLSRNGFSSVSMADIGTEVGIAASAIYWHFPSKQALLVSVFDECLERLGRAQGEAVEQSSDSEDALRRLVDQHVDFVVAERDLARVYYQESVHLPEDDQRRLRRKQAAMVAVWIDLLCSCREGMGREAGKALVGAAIGAVQSALRSRSQLGGEAHRSLLTDAAWRVLTP
jgi:AcrR family transcriptional regulator